MSLSQPTDPLGALAPAAPAGQPTPPKAPLAELETQGRSSSAWLSRWLASARSRARRLLAGQALFSLLALAVAALAGSAALAAAQGPLAGRALLVALLAAFPLGAALALRFPLRDSMARAALMRDRLALAAWLARAPGADGLTPVQTSELLSSLELADSPPRGASTALLALLHQRAQRTAQSLELRRALPRSSLRLPALALLLALGGLGLFALRAPQTLALGLSRLWLGEAAMPIPENEPIAGDLSITYLYPAYTNLPSRTEEGTPGDLKAPRGTVARITARADRDLVQAYAVVDETPVPLEASGQGHRALSGELKLEKNGKWRFRFADKKGRPVAEGPDRSIELVADQPPTATISDPQAAEVEVDPLGRLPVIWSAQDDYGLTKVALVWSRAGEKETRVELAAPTGAARRLSGTYGWEMAKLELREGDKISFRVEALDGDTVDGPQKGVSATHSLKVFSAAEHHQEGIQRAQALWERLVVLLADRLEEKAPPKDDGAKWYAETQGRDSRALQLIAELRQAGVDLAADKLAPRALGRALKYVASGLSPLVQRTVIARAPLSKPGAATPGALKLLARALGNEMAEEEKDVLYLSDLLDQSRLDDIRQLREEMKRSREELKKLAEKLKNAPDEQTKKQVLAEVERLKDRAQELMKRLQQLAKGVNDEHLNQEALESAQKEQDLMSQLNDVQKKMQSGDTDAALSELDKLNKTLEQLEQNLDQDAKQRGSQKYAEEAKQLRQAAEKMAQLKAREEELEKRTGRLRKALREQAHKLFEQKGGKQLTQKLADKVAEAKKQIAQVDPAVADALALEETLDAAQERVADLQRALQAGDYQEALEQASKADRAAQILQSRLGLEDELRQLGQPAPVRKSLEAAAQAEAPLREVAQALRDAIPDEDAQMNEQQKQELQQQAQEQREIGQGMQQVREQLGEVGKKVPIFGPQHEQLLQGAQEAMDQAQGKLSQRDARGGEGGENEALDKIGKFEEAMKDLAKSGSQGEGGMPMPWGEPQGSGQDDGDQEGEGREQSREHVEIPDAESSRGPQEFRKKLLDAMKQPAPEKFKDKVRGYYEELVK